MHHPYTSSRQHGVTLIELMIVIVIIGIFAAMAIPNVDRWVVRQRIDSTAKSIANTFTFARAEAIRRNQPVYIVPGLIRKDGKLGGQKSDWALSDSQIKNGQSLALLVFADKDPVADTVDTLSKYGTGEDLMITPLDNRSTTRFAARSLTNQGADDNQFTNLGFVISPTGIIRFAQDNQNLGNARIGSVGRITVADKRKPKVCRVIRVNSLGNPEVCTVKETDRAGNQDFCRCRD